MKNNFSVRPPFASEKSLIGFLLMLVGLIALPVIFGFSGLVDKETRYKTMKKFHISPYFYQQIYLENEPLDIVFVGFSALWSGLNANKIENDLSAEMDRKARVITLGVSTQGDDIVFTVLRNLLERRPVKMVIMSLPTHETEEPHPYGRHLFDPWNDREYMDGLSLREAVRAYSMSVLSAPRHLLSVMRADKLSAVGTKLAGNNGAVIRERSWGRKRALNFKEITELKTKRPWVWEFDKFQPKDIKIPLVDTNMKIIKNVEDSKYYYKKGYSDFQLLFFKKIRSLLAEKGVEFALINMPRYSERGDNRVPLKIPVEETLAQGIPIIGSPGTTVFSEVPTNNHKHYFFNNNHLNKNGVALFTGFISPAVVQLFKDMTGAQ